MRGFSWAVLVGIGLQGCAGGEDGDDDQYPSPGQHDDTGTDDGDGGDGDDGDDGDDGGSGSGSGSGGDDSGDDGGSGAFQPTAGHWTYTGGDLVSDSCNVDDDCLEDPGNTDSAGFQLGVLSETRLLFQQDGADDAATCDLDDQVMSCDAIASSEPVDEVSATISSSLVSTGTFADEETLSGDHAIDISCQGSDCSLIEWYCDVDFPCVVVLSFEASHDGS